MLKKASISWNVKQINKMISNGNITFENAVQRGFEWDKKRMSLLVHSLICGYPVPPFFARRGEDKTYDMLDGKQRMTTINKFYSNEFELIDCPPIEYDINGVTMEMDINGCKYENLPEEVQDELDSTSLTVYYFDDITEDEVADMFFRLNNGKPCSSSVTTRVRALSKDKIKELGQHRLFQMALTKKALENYTNEDIVIKALYIYNGGDNLETKNVREWISETEITKTMVADLSCIFGRIADVAEAVKEDKKLAKKILTKTHMLSLIPMIEQSREDKMRDEDLVKWISNFYGKTDEASNSVAYNKACSNGANKVAAVTTRFSELEKSYNKFKKK